MTDRDAIATSDRIVLRPWRVDEGDRFFDMHRRIEVARWISGRPMADRDEAIQLIERNLERLAADPRFGSWAVVPRRTGMPAGSVLLKPLPDGAGEVEIGWHLHPDSWGRGLATEAAAMLLARGFQQGLDEVWAVTDPANDRSIRVCEKLGMRLLGRTQRWYHETSLMFWAGARADQQPSIAPDEPVVATAHGQSNAPGSPHGISVRQAFSTETSYGRRFSTTRVSIASRGLPIVALYAR